ncbi:glycosyltransferase [Spirosoma validum]|uniref:Streptomycin biosynthesis protein StrF domain-containing protein n=1 Tax=Spirosoma validum TaxID=2771355 RepID=A0A927B0K1_9BACT|nr:glycosyltransferase [Spirosoma validum]MBD2753319.1 hypothetical protein [Spirosoma validum]
MLSIIVSSYNEDYFQNLAKSISLTVGITYEIIKIENSGLMGICAAYNIGASEAQYPNLCFCHEDVIFKTKNWGQLVSDNLKDEQIGVIGIAGGNYKSKEFSPSWFNFLEQGNKINIIQHSRDKSIKYINENSLNETLSKVVTLDGVFMCCTKKVWEKYNFDEKLLNGFHFYDMDFSLGIYNCGYNNYVTYEILLEHFSEGQNNLDWYKQGIKIHEKWKKKLPISINVLTKKIIDTVEFRTLDFKFHYESKESLKMQAIKTFLCIIKSKPFNKNNYWYCKELIRLLLK